MRGLEFIIVDPEIPEGRFEWGMERNQIFDLYYKAEELFEVKEFEKAEEIYKTVIDKDPEFIDAYVSLGYIDRKIGNHEKAYNIFQKGYEIGNQLIPEKFNGEIIWGFIDNRPFLRAVKGLGLSSLSTGKPEEAIELFQSLLNFNSNDNQGVRYLLGDAFLNAGYFDKAEKIFSENLDFSPNRYNYALILVVQNKLLSAITQFRKAFLDNVYIAEFLVNETPKVDYFSKRFSNYHMLETAFSYLKNNPFLWSNNPKSFSILNFLFNHEKVIEDIEQYYSLKNKLADIEGIEECKMNKRKSFLRKIDAFQATITEKSSSVFLEEIKGKKIV
ncbi:tetratricopeptide repeat protein [Fodinibius salsisoli]|uniref:Tetratricopeptide repeat protein n=1 Tax=Fodinibius salsisoli TaxID=2820877 RepID=A0ABT3PIP0_9BACT|nr:tetratricopeptide repeat protein [Fodinibius salsisoli]MCW9705796.1 tetratricopeptide repeat protein [Fodinibius salsisoli]